MRGQGQIVGASVKKSGQKKDGSVYVLYSVEINGLGKGNSFDAAFMENVGKTVEVEYKTDPKFGTSFDKLVQVLNLAPSQAVQSHNAPTAAQIPTGQEKVSVNASEDVTMTICRGWAYTKAMIQFAGKQMPAEDMIERVAKDMHNRYWKQ